MHTLVKSFIVFATAIVAMWAVRTYLFTIYTVPENHAEWHLQAGDRVLVNRLSRTNLTAGDLIVYGDSCLLVARITAVPGDTVRIGQADYRLPTHCCTRCGCPNCYYYMVNTGKSRTLVHRHSIQGRAIRLFNLRLWQ